MFRATSFLALWTVTAAAAASANHDYNTKNIIVTMKDGVSNALYTIDSETFLTREEKLIAVVNTLENQADVSQNAVLEYLNAEDSNGRRLQSHTGVTKYWISNQMYIEGATDQMMAELRGIEGVESVELEEQFPIIEEPEEISNDTASVNAVQWGIDRVRADEAWASGFNGQNIIVANIDTGVRGDHYVLRNQFLGTYGWYDPYGKTSSPNDQNGHGTHTMGTIVGSNGYGVAPGAKWMACKGCSQRSCSASALLACGQFLLCPHRTTGPNSQRDCNKAPHVINNSWGGGQGSSWYMGIVNAWRAAGIIPVFSAGNSGNINKCGTANSPGDYNNVIGVGSTTIGRTLSSFSSVGPTAWRTIKPDISAPGSSVRSAYKDGPYSFATMSGTSMAAPHVTGVIALMLSKNSALSYDTVSYIIEQRADRSLALGSQTCGQVSQNRWPNNHFGHGRIDAMNAVSAVSSPCRWVSRVGCYPQNQCYFDWSSWTCVRR